MACVRGRKIWNYRPWRLGTWRDTRLAANSTEERKLVAKMEKRENGDKVGE